MRCICFPTYGLSLLVFRACIGFWGGGVAIGCIGIGNKILACCKASLVNFGKAFNSNF